MDLTVPTITRNQVADVIRTLGLDPKLTRHVTLGRDRIEAVCYLLDENGRKYAVDDEVATTSVTIPITGDYVPDVPASTEAEEQP